MNPVSDSTIRDALETWVEEDMVLDSMYAVWSNLMDSPYGGLDQAFTYQAQVGINYTLAARIALINDWMAAAGESGRTTEEWAALEPDPGVMAELNQAITVQGIDRFFIYLYVHSHLLNVITGGGPLSAMDEIRTRIIRRPR
jgi:hypothetical protein